MARRRSPLRRRHGVRPRAGAGRLERDAGTGGESGAETPEAAITADAVPCAVCGEVVHVAAFHMTRRVVVQLCRVHRSAEFLARDDGWEFTQRMEAAWRSHGVATAQRMAALAAHRRTYGPRAQPSRCPGSYSWPALRREAERRFGQHEAPAEVIADLRDRHRDGLATVPSVQTMRRWFREARWLDRPPRRDVSVRRPGRGPRNALGAGEDLGQERWYTKTGKPPHPMRHIVPMGMRMQVFPPFDALYFDMSRAGPADDDFGDRWIHGPDRGGGATREE